MANGSLTITVTTYRQLNETLQRVLCWSPVKGLIQINTRSGMAAPSIIIPEAAFGPSPLQLKRGGPNVIAGYVPGTHITFTGGNSAAISRNATTCPNDIVQPTITTVEYAADKTVTVNYSNAVGFGPVNIHWGDGTSSLNLPESGAAVHSYGGFGAPFGITIRIEDASNPSDFGEFTLCC